MSYEQPDRHLQGEEGMSKKRFANPSEVFPKRKDAQGNPLCAVCGKVLSGRARRYCSSECREICYVATMPTHARLRVKQRDHGVCANCGCDTEKLRRILESACRSRWGDNPGWLLLERDIRDVKREIGFTSLHLWEMDHKVPVVEGGGLCGLENLQTLCIPCHRAETRELAARRAAAKRGTPLFT